MSLLAVPEEVLARIVGYLSPKDAYNFGRSCRYLVHELYALQIGGSSTDDRKLHPLYLAALRLYTIYPPQLELPTIPDRVVLDKLIGFTVGGVIRISKLIRHDAHSSVYSVACPTGESLNLEARAFQLNGIPPKLRAHRLRNIKRLSNRAVLEAKAKLDTEAVEKLIVIYTTDKERSQENVQTKLKSSMPESSDQEVTLSLKNIKVTKDGGKSDKVQETLHQCETARIRQHERRKAKRQEEKQLKSPQDQPESAMVWDGDDSEIHYLLLRLAHDGGSDLHRHLHPMPRDLPQRHMSTHALGFKDAAELEAFMMLKYDEILFLNRQLQKLRTVLDRGHEDLGTILDDQMSLPRESEAYLLVQDKVNSARHRLTAMRHVILALPGIIASAETTFRSLKSRLGLVNEKKREVEEVKEKHDSWEGLKKEVKFATMCSREFIPGSGPYIQIAAQLHAAQARLGKLESKSAHFVERLKRLTMELEGLLAAPSQEAIAIED